MKEAQLRQHAVCSFCGQPIGHTGIPLFWILRVRRYGLQLGAIQQQTGLAMMLGGNEALAQVMGADRDMARPVTPEVTLTACETCMMDQPMLVAHSIRPDADDTDPDQEGADNDG